MGHSLTVKLDVTLSHYRSFLVGPCLEGAKISKKIIFPESRKGTNGTDRSEYHVGLGYEKRTGAFLYKNYNC